MPKVNGQTITRLAGQPCANPRCTRTITARGVHHLCWGCDAHWRKYTVPVAGFIASGDLKVITKSLLKEIAPTPSQQSKALRLMRGTRHRQGPWSERPAYRLQPLLHGRWNQRLSHLLTGRRAEPTVKAIVNAVVHHHLATVIIGTRSRYNHYLAGGTFYGRRAPIAPAGSEVLTGGAKTAGYRLNVTDFSAIGQRCLQAGEALGIGLDNAPTGDRILSLYAKGLEAGHCHRPIILPYGAFPTTAAGDHPFDHVFTTKSDIPARYRGCVRRASGLIRGAWPEGFDLSAEELDHQRRQPRPHPFQTKTTDIRPDTGWIFGTPQEATP